MKATEQIEFKTLNKVEDKLKDFKDKHGWIDYIIAPIIVMIIVLAVYAIKGVYPFGRNTIAYYDMPAQYVPFYSGAWDILHGKIGLFLNWYFGLGVPSAAGLGQFVYFPTNVFLFFTSRDNILYSLSFLLMLKMVLSACPMSFYCKNKYSISSWTVCAGILYACSGYVIQYYTNLFFLDYVIMLPMIVWALERLVTEHKYKAFILFLFLSFITNFQFAAMLVIYLIIKVYFILYTVPDEKRGKSIRLFAISGISVALLSAVIMVPSIVVTLGSSRMDLNSEFNYISTLKEVFCQFRKEKQFMMYGGEAAVGLGILMLIKDRKKSSKYWHNISMILILGLPILLEGVNILWHFGSYKHFPIRFGYMLTFELLVYVGEYLKGEDIIVPKIIGRIAKLVSVAAMPFVAYVLFVFFKQFTKSAISDLSSYESYGVYFWTLSISFFVIFLVNEKNVRNNLLVILAVIQAFCGCYGFIAPELGFADGARIRYLFNSLEDRTLFEGEDLKNTERVKSEALNYESDYGEIIERPSIGLWAYGISADTESLLVNNMGYHGTQTMILDEGGTVFSDALLGVTRILSENIHDNLLYEDIEGKLKLHKSIYTMPFGLVTEDNSLYIDETSFEFHDKLFKTLTGSSEDLINIKEAKEYLKEERELSDSESITLRRRYDENIPLKETMDGLQDSNESLSVMESQTESEMSLSQNAIDAQNQSAARNKEYVLSISTKGAQSIYLDIADKFTGEMFMILNDRELYFSSVMTENSNSYPNDIYNGIIPLGSYENNTAELKIYTTNANLDGVKIGILDLDILSKGIKAAEKNQELNVECLNNGMKVTGKVNKDGTLFFPVGYSRDWHVKVNGKKAEVKPYINNAFISVDVTKGDVDIDFWYWPRGLTLGIILSILGIASLIILNVVMKRGGITGKKYEKVVDKVFIYGFNAVAIAILVVMYVIPIYVKLAL